MLFSQVLTPSLGGPALDIERGKLRNIYNTTSRLPPAALNKMEKVAIRYSDKKKRPLVLILNNIHLFKNDDDGKQILLQFQQRAEAWAASGMSVPSFRRVHANLLPRVAGIVTVVFSSCVLRMFD